MKLGECHLQGNALALETLSSLTEVIELAALDLRILNLRSNELKVESDEDVRIWEHFLEAVSRCTCLQRLDLGDNPLGDLAMECFAKALFHRHTTMQNNLQTIETTACELSSLQIEDTKSEAVLDTPSDSPGRSAFEHIACIQVDRTNLTDYGGLFLSYLLEQHTTGSSQDTQRTRDNSRAFPSERVELSLPHDGINFEGNEFSHACQRLLEVAERSTEASSDSGFGSSSSSPSRRRYSIASTPVRRRSSLEPAHGHSRNSSIVASSANELDRARTKVQGLLLKESSASNIPVLLWKAALRMLDVARLFVEAGTIQLLPLDVWKRILILSCDSSARLSPDKVSAIFEYALHPDSTFPEENWEGHLSSIRVWRLLEAIHCLSY